MYALLELLCQGTIGLAVSSGCKISPIPSWTLLQSAAEPLVLQVL